MTLRDHEEVATCGSHAEAETIVGFLAAEGIPAMTIADDGGGVLAAQTFSMGVRVLVPSELADEARRLLAEVESPPPLRLVKDPDPGEPPQDEE